MTIMTGNGKHSTYNNGDDWRIVYDCFDHISGLWKHDLSMSNGGSS